MAPKLYMIESSAVVRSVLLTEAALGLSLEYVPVNLYKGEQFNPEFLKLNPLHTLPTLVDGDKVIVESAAINIYLVEKYGKDSSLYPKDPYKKALVNQILHFVSSDLFPTARHVVKPIMLEGATKMCPEGVKEIVKSFDRLETLLEGRVWAAGDDLTVADFALIPIVSSSDVFIPVDEMKKYPNIMAWFDRAKQLPYYHRNVKGDNEFKTIFLEKLHS